MSADDALRRHEGELRRLPGVKGVGLGEDSQGQQTIIVFVDQAEDPSAVRALVPSEIEGHRTEIQPEIVVFPGQEKGQSKDGEED